MNLLTQLAQWQALQTHQKAIAEQTMQNWFQADPLRFEKMSLQVDDILLDYSKNRLNEETLQLLCNLANAANLSEKIEGLFTGKPLNSTESRPALHTALRNSGQEPVWVDGVNIMPEIHATWAQMREFTDKVRDQSWCGATGKPIRDIVNIGIGGSHLGPLTATQALNDFAIDTLRCHFISNIDGSHLNDVFKQIDPETTLFIISSKSFTTLETMTNARTIRLWLEQKLGKKDLSSHFVAVTAAKQKALEFGIPEKQIFPVWEWVGGRYSVWSAIGLPLALMVGMDHFHAFLAGAHAMDEHFRKTPFSKNMPVILALLGIWYINFFDAQTHAIVPYTHLLNQFRAHLQQLDMESNGKRITHQGAQVDYVTGPIIFGEHGCNGQHAFHQLFHQGQHLVPIDFILVGKNHDSLDHHQDILIASGLGQAQALLQGKTVEQALDELRKQGVAEKDAQSLAAHKAIPGNRPSTILFLKSMTPYNLGALLALYEHKIFVQGAIWDINSFDQWGVELGKQLLPDILNDLQNPHSNTQHDPSTAGLIEYYKSLRSADIE